MRTAETARPNYDFVTGLRGIAASYVLLSHVWYQIWPAVPEPFGYGRRPEGVIAWLTGWLYFGHFGVVIFIVVSGFCLMLPVAGNGDRIRGGIPAYLRRRIRRIVPPYYFAMILTLLAIYFLIGEKTGSQWDIALPVTSFGILTHMALVNDLFESTRINYVYWSIALEAQLYLLFPLLVWFVRRQGLATALVLSVSLVYGTIIGLELYGLTSIPPQFVGMCAYFIFGLATAKIINMNDCQLMSRVQNINIYKMGILLIALAYLCAIRLGFDAAERHFAFLDTLVALGTALFLIAASRSERSPARIFFESPFLLRIGTFSYSLYLIHAPILQIIWQYIIIPFRMSENNQFIALLVIAVPLVLVMAYCFFLLFERPFMSSSDQEVFRFIHWIPGLRPKLE